MSRFNFLHLNNTICQTRLNIFINFAIELLYGTGGTIFFILINNSIQSPRRFI